MFTIVAYRSALRFWLKVETSIDDVSKPSVITELTHACGNAGFIVRCNLVEFGPPPFHLLVGPDARRVATAHMVCHQSRCKYPPGSFRKIRKGVYVVSPELLFLQMALQLSFPKLVELGFFLCGTYAYDGECGLIGDRMPLTKVSSLASYLTRCEGMRGNAKAKRALACVCEGSASPQETRLAMLFSLPKKKGGYGFPKPQMNYRIGYSSQERELYGRHYSILDIYWPDWKLGVEYDGREYHGDSDAIARDRRKSSEMATRNITIVRVDRNQLRGTQDVFVLAKKLGRIGKRYVLTPSPSQWQAKAALFSELRTSIHS